MTKNISKDDLRKAFGQFGVVRRQYTGDVTNAVETQRKKVRADRFRENVDLRHARRASKHQNIAEEEKFRHEHSHLYETNIPRRRLPGFFLLILIFALAFLMFAFSSSGNSQYLVAGGGVLLLLVLFRG